MVPKTKIAIIMILVMLITLPLSACQLSGGGTSENEVSSFLKNTGVRAKAMKDPTFGPGFEDFEGPPPETKEDVLERINNGILVQGTITKVDVARIPSGDEVWYIASATLSADEVVFGEAPKVIRISNIGHCARQDETKGEAAIPNLKGIREGSSGLFLVEKKTGTECQWIIDDITIEAESLGEYSILERFDREKNNVVTRDGISIPFAELGQEAAPSDGSADYDPLVFCSVQDLVDAVRSERQTDQKDPAAQFNCLEDISTLYVPAAESLRINEIWVDPNCISYNCTLVPADVRQDESENHYEVQINRDTSSSFDEFCKKHHMEPNADGIALWDGSTDTGPIYYQQDDAIITIIGPGGLGDYDTLQSLREMEKIDISE